MNDNDHANIADVFYAYRLLLGREPDAGGLAHYIGQISDGQLSIGLLRRDFISSTEWKDIAASFVQAAATSPYFHYQACFDVPATISRHAAPNLEPSPGYLTNFLGVRIDPKFFNGLLDKRAGEVESLPIPANWHADMAEWGAALRAVELSEQQFTMIELGCGWGCWMNNSGMAARNIGRKVRLIGVEGDAVHAGFARESLSTNRFLPEQVTVNQGVAAANSGTALFPQEDRDGHGWGGQPVFGVTDAERDEAVKSGRYDALKMFSLAELTGEIDRVDLLHVDVQGGEADVVAGSLQTLNDKVRYLLIGTHSRAIEGRLHETLLSAGWALEIERPGLLDLTGIQPVMHVDGVQGWRNPALF